MKLNRNSWHYKCWRKSFSHGDYIPEETDLCRYCHKVFWQLIGYACFASMIAVTVGMAGFMLFYLYGYKGLWLHPLTTLAYTGALAAAITLVVFYVRWLGRGRSYRAPQTLVGKFAAASKQRVCPLVEFSDSDEE